MMEMKSGSEMLVHLNNLMQLSSQEDFTQLA
jgi:hypothetical protein